MNQVEKLWEGETSIAVVGINEASFEMAAKWSQQFHVKLYDNRWGDENKAQFIVDEIFAPNSSLLSEASILAVNEECQNCSIFYFSGLSSFSNDWEDLKLSVLTVAQHMTKGSWIVFGPDIDPDLVEVVLVELLERHSGLRLSEGFHIAFSPIKLKKHYLEKLGNEVKMSHNLIINSLTPLFTDDSTRDDLDNKQISYQREARELKNMEEQVKKIWVPVLNKMSRNTFSELVRACYQSDFLEPYNYLHLSTEWRVNVDRFFTFATQNGLKSSFLSIAEAKGLISSVPYMRFSEPHLKRNSFLSLF